MNFRKKDKRRNFRKKTETFSRNKSANASVLGNLFGYPLKFITAPLFSHLFTAKKVKKTRSGLIVEKEVMLQTPPSLAFASATSSTLEEEILLSKSGKSYYFPYFFVEQPKNI